MMKTTSLAKCLPVAFLLSCGAAVKADVKEPGTDKPQSAPVAGNACEADEECITGEVCDEDANKCAPTCADDNDCDGELKCIDKNEKMYCGESTAECAEDLDCDPGKICDKEGACKTPRCAPLGKDVCPTGYGCMQGACVKQQTNTACMNAADCNAVASCKTDKCDCVASKCQQKPATVTCTTANESTVCKAGEFCDNGACKSVTTKTCTVDNDCPAKSVCAAPQVPGPSSCTPGCRSDADCTGGLLCDLNATKQCVAPSQVQGKSCTSDQDCSPGCASMTAPAEVCDFPVGVTTGKCKKRCTSGLESLAGQSLGIPLDGFVCPSGEVCSSVNTSGVNAAKTGENCGFASWIESFFPGSGLAGNGYSFCRVP